MACLEPPLSVVPKSQWFCDACLIATGGDYGFEEGQEHSLHSFRKRADEFRKRWLESHIPRHWKGRKEANGKSVERSLGHDLSQITPSSSQDGEAAVPTSVGAQGGRAAFPSTNSLPTPATTPLSTRPEEPSSSNLESFEDSLLTEDFIEREFWRLVESQDETVEVEYGADIHATKYGR